MATFRITNLRLRTIIGVYDWERDVKQDVVINIEFEAEVSKSFGSDQVADTVDYKTMAKKVIDLVEGSGFNLIEKLGDNILDVVMEDPRVSKAIIRVDKPGALRFADSVSVEVSRIL